MKILSLFAVALLMLCPHLHALDKGVQKAIAGQLKDSGSVPSLKSDKTNAAGIVTILRERFGLAICFEGQELDFKTQGISARQEYDELSAKKNLTPNEVAALKMVTELVKTAPATNISWRETQYAVDYTGQTPLAFVSDLLDKLSAEYNISADHSYLVIFPGKGSVLMAKVESIDLSGKTLGSALQQLEPVFEKNHVDLMELLMGPGAEERQNRLNNSGIDHLKLRDVTLLDLLVKLGQATTPPTVWTLAGTKGNRFLSFNYAMQMR